MKHALVVAVAVTYVVVSVAEGGFPPEALAAGTLVIWWAVVVGLAVGAWPRTEIPRAAIAAGLCIAGLALLTTLSLGWASDNGRAFVEVVRVAGYAGLFVLVVITSPVGSARTWLLGLAIGLVAVAAIALGSRFEESLPGGDRQIGEFIPSATGRLSYPLGYWNALGACMALAVVLLAWLGARGETRWGRAAAIGALPPVLLTGYLTSSRGPIAAAVVGVTILIALGPGRARLLGGLGLGVGGGALLALAAGLRSPLIDDPETAAARFAGHEILLATLIAAAGVGVIRYMLDRPLERLAIRRAATRGALVACAALAVLALVAVDPVERFEQFKSYEPHTNGRETYIAGHLTSGIGSGRYQFWSAGLDAFASQPLRGIGAGGYEAWWNQHGAIERPLRNAHSLFVETLAELGVGGLLLVGGFLALGAVHGWKRRGAGSPDGAIEVSLALLAAGVVSAAIDWMWEMPAAFVPVVVAVALLVGPATIRGAPSGARAMQRVGPQDGNGAPAQPVRTARGSFGWGVATLLAGWVAIWISVVLLLTEAKLNDSRAAVDRGNLSAAASHASDASTLQPWAAQPYMQLALVQRDAGHLQTAGESIARAIERAPEDWSGWYVASRIEGLAGNRERAEELFVRAAELNPRAALVARREDTR